jgi:hypothetical protein
MMSKYRKGMLYVRRLKPTDRADNLTTAAKMAAKAMICQDRGLPPPFVMIRHGMREMQIMHVAYSRSELLSSINGGRKTFKETARAWRIKDAQSSSQ